MPKTSQYSDRPNRQAQGLACDECRARKLRCDRVTPTCSTCENLGVTCTPNTDRQPRGPRRGHMKALQSRISALERRLADELPPSNGHSSVESDKSPRQQSEEAKSDGYEEQAADGFYDRPSGFQEAADDFRGDTGVEEESSWQPSSEHPAMLPAGAEEELSALQSIQPQSLQPTTHSFSFPPLLLSSSDAIEQPSTLELQPDMVRFTSVSSNFDPGSFLLSKPTHKDSLSSASSDFLSRFNDVPALQMSELMKADLNHLYFDRVHFFAPILSRRRYFARAARPKSVAAPFVALQYAMWTLAAGLGSQFKDIQNTLYVSTRVLLEEWELDIIAESPSIELAQAWMLLAIYEIMQVNYNRGWLSAGRCFRLVQLMKLHEIDVTNGIAESGLSYVEVEERRRTFWMAYSLDRFINLMNQMPLTLNEQVILTRLPAPEAGFQRERPAKTRFLSEVITGGDDLQFVSSFNACIVLVTISGRCLSHQQQCNVERAYGNMPQDFIARHQWLEGILADKIKAMLTSSSQDPEDEPADPMLLFANMAAQATTLLLGKAMQSVSWDCQDLLTGYEQKAFKAAQNISQLAQKLEEFGYFKIHPFTPIPLFFCAEFAQTRKHRGVAFEALYDVMISRLRDLSAVNILVETCLAKFNS